MYLSPTTLILTSGITSVSYSVLPAAYRDFDHPPAHRPCLHSSSRPLANQPLALVSYVPIFCLLMLFLQKRKRKKKELPYYVFWNNSKFTEMLQRGSCQLLTYFSVISTSYTVMVYLSKLRNQYELLVFSQLIFQQESLKLSWQVAHRAVRRSDWPGYTFWVAQG